jgi:rsbT co-antagonist protein RsbR
MDNSTRIPDILHKFESDILAEWVRQQLASAEQRKSPIREHDLRDQCREFLTSFRAAAQEGGLAETSGRQWDRVRDLLANLTRERASLGFSPVETAMFVFSLKLPLFAKLRQEYGSDEAGLAAEIWTATLALDRLGLFTTDMHQKAREEVIARQQQEMLELSTPVVKLWDGILALPLIGTLDSARTQVVMESLLQQIVSTGAGIAIIDITGVPTVDTLVAQHLLKTVAAARLMGADCIISGIRPQIAQTIVHLGVVLTDVITKATLADAFILALERTGSTVVKRESRT